MSRKLDCDKSLLKELADFPPKHFKQVVSKILMLTQEPYPSDSKALIGYDQLLRVDSGEYRIIYTVSEEQVTIILVGKRNDDEVYRHLERKFR